MKKIVTILGILFLSAALTTPALAHGPGWGKGYNRTCYGEGGPGFCRQQDREFDKLTEQQRDQLDKLHETFYDDTAQLKDDIRSKSRDLDRLLDKSTPDTDKALSLQKEISDLEAKLAQKRLDFRLEAKKIAPELELRLGKAFGRGPYGDPMKGPAPDMGRHMRGYGPGPCWD
ncbi:MAG TPA: periplasmic heavy metal sensor [Desulfatiglandales bacterium]|nr:periplasmic heavy metal sensor [Desulfatiglandales bacterium]